MPASTREVNHHMMSEKTCEVTHVMLASTREGDHRMMSVKTCEVSHALPSSTRERLTTRGRRTHVKGFKFGKTMTNPT